MKKLLLALILLPCLSVAQEDATPEAVKPFLKLADKQLDIPFAAGQLLKQIKVDGQQLQFIIQDDTMGYLNDNQMLRVSEYLKVSTKYIFCKSPGMSDAVEKGWSAQYIYQNMNGKVLIGPLTIDNCASLPADAGVLAEHMVSMLNDMEPVQMGPLVIHGGTLEGKAVQAYMKLSTPIEELNEEQIEILEKFTQSFEDINDNANCSNGGTKHMIDEGYSVSTAITSQEGEILQNFTTSSCPSN